MIFNENTLRKKLFCTDVYFCFANRTMKSKNLAELIESGKNASL